MTRSLHSPVCQQHSGDMADSEDMSLLIRWSCAAPAALLRPPLGRGTQHRALAPLCTHWQDTGDSPQVTSRTSHWGPSAGTGTAAPGHGGASTPRHGTESLTRTRGLRCCQGLMGGSAVPGSIPKAWPFPGGEADPGWGQCSGLSPGRVPLGLPLPTLCPTQWPMETKRCSGSPPLSSASTAKGSPRLSVCTSSSETRQGGTGSSGALLPPQPNPLQPQPSRAPQSHPIAHQAPQSGGQWQKVVTCHLWLLSDGLQSPGGVHAEPAQDTSVHKHRAAPTGPPHLPMGRTCLTPVVPQTLSPLSWSIAGAEASTDTPQCVPL